MRLINKLFNLLAGIGVEISAIVRVLGLLRWKAWAVWGLLLLMAFAGALPSVWMLTVQCAILLGFGMIAIFSGRVAAFIRRRHWVRLPDGKEVVPFLPQLILLLAFPLFFSAMAVLFWKAAQVSPGILPAEHWDEAFVLAANNFLRCQFFFDAAEIFHVWIGDSQKPTGWFGPSLILICRVIMDVVFLKLAFQLLMAGYYRARGLGRGEDNLLLLREAMPSRDAPRVRQFSESVRNSLCNSVDAILKHLDRPGKRSEAGHRAWLSLRAMKDFALPYLQDRVALADADETSRLEPIIERLRDSEAVTNWRQIERDFPVRSWPFLLLAAVLISGAALPFLLADARASFAAALAMIALAAWMLLGARGWINVLLLRWQAIRPYWPSSLPRLLAQWSLALAPLLIVSVTAMFFYLEKISPHDTFVTVDGEKLDDSLGWDAALGYVAANLLRTNIFFDTIEVYDIQTTRVETYDGWGCTLTLITRMIFDLGFLSLWISVFTVRFNQIFRGVKLWSHMDLKIQIEAQENGGRSSRFVLFYYRRIREVLLNAMRDSLEDRNLLAALGYSGFLTALKNEIDHEQTDEEINAVHRANLGFALAMQSRLQEAGEEQRLALEMLEQLDLQTHPDAAKNLAGVRLELAFTLESQERWDAALIQYNEAIELFEHLSSDGDTEVQVDLAFALNYLAWLLATCPVEEHRDGGAAIERAKRACELTDDKNLDYIDTLAAAHAELGEFEEAIRLQERVCKDPRDHVDMLDFESRLKLYREGKAFHRTDEDLQSRAP